MIFILLRSNNMRVLIACEESQRECAEFRKLGHEAYSCDLQDCSGGHPEWHICGDALKYINGKCEFITGDGVKHMIDTKWDLLIAHPPCTYLSFAGNKYLNLETNTPAKVVDRLWSLCESSIFFMKFVSADCEKICVENPLGYMSKFFRKPNQIIHPYYFANTDDIANYQYKRTCLWLKNLPKLIYPANKPKPEPVAYTSKGKPQHFTDVHGKIKGVKCDSNSAKARSKSFASIARAMGEQWGGGDKYNGCKNKR